MRNITDEEINFYLKQDPDCVNYAVGLHPWRFYSACFVKEIQGSYHNLLTGLPLELVIEMIKEVE